MYLGMRPYTRRSVLHMLQESQDEIISSHDDQAQEILAKLLTELAPEIPDGADRADWFTGCTRRIRG